jgi:hypothetical protein
MKKLLMLVSAVAVALPTLSAPPPYYIAGDFNSWNAAGAQMTETSPGSGIWSATLNVGSGRHEFKITEGDWNWSYPGPNSWLYAPASGNITVTFNTNTNGDGWSTASQRIGLNADPGTWTAAGDFQGWNNAAGNMTPVGGGVYEYILTSAGTWNWKAVVTGSWDSISYDNRSVGTGNWTFTINPGQEAQLFVNALAGTAMVNIVAIPEPSVLALAGWCGLALGGCWLRRRA